MLYPTELLGQISKIFNFSPPTDSNELPLRRRSRYPLRYQGLCTMFNFFAIFGGCSYFRLGGRCSVQLSYWRVCNFYSFL